MVVLCAAVACSKNKLVEESEGEDVGTLGVEFTGPDPETHHYDGDAITVSVTVDDTHDDYSDIVLDRRSNLQGSVADSVEHLDGRFEGEVYLEMGEHILTVYASDGDRNEDEDKHSNRDRPRELPAVAPSSFHSDVGRDARDDDPYGRSQRSGRSRQPTPCGEGLDASGAAWKLCS